MANHQQMPLPKTDVYRVTSAINNDKTITLRFLPAEEGQEESTVTMDMQLAVFTYQALERALKGQTYDSDSIAA
jgi:hypothetical protein